MQRIHFELETVETITIRTRSQYREEYCPRCLVVAQMATPFALASISGISERTIFQLVETGRVHFIEPDQVFVCLKCLMDQRKYKNDQKSAAALLGENL